MAKKKKTTRVNVGGRPTSSNRKKMAPSSTRNASSTRKETGKRSPSGQGKSGGGKKSARRSGGAARKKVTSKKKSTSTKAKSVTAKKKEKAGSNAGAAVSKKKAGGARKASTKKKAAANGQVGAKTKAVSKTKAPLKKKVSERKKKPAVKKKSVTGSKSAASQIETPVKSPVSKRGGASKKEVSKSAPTTGPNSKTKVSRSKGRSKAAAKAVPEKKKPMSAALRRALRGPKAGMLDEQVPAGSARGGGGTSKRAAKSRISAAQLQYFEELLWEKRNKLIGSVQALEDDALRGDGEGTTHRAFHPDDQGAEAYDQDFKLLLAASERTMLEEIDEALKRIENGTFGICEVTGKPIPAARLEAKPWARVCIEVARARDYRSMFS